MTGKWQLQAGGPVGDFFTEVSKDTYVDHDPVNKFGRNPDVDTATDPEDVWDAGGIWVAPTVARVHDVASSDVADTAAGTGARTVKVSGLTGWDAAEVSETVTLNGTSNVATVNSYVVVHRMQVMTVGSGGTNAGNITATAQTDSTVTAQISAGKGQILMAIYGVPADHQLQLVQWYMGMNRAAAAAASADLELYVKASADQPDSAFVVKHHLGLASSGSSHVAHEFKPLFKISGPAIIKAQVENVSANDTDISAGFDGVLVAA